VNVFAQPPGLGERGSTLFRQLSKDVTDYGRFTLIVEAARLADRLDELDNIIQGKGVLNLMQFRLEFPEGEDEPFTVEVKFQNVLSEARQQQNALRQIISDLSRNSAAAPASAPPKVAPASVEDELAARRARREAERSG